MFFPTVSVVYLLFLKVLLSKWLFIDGCIHLCIQTFRIFNTLNSFN